MIITTPYTYPTTLRPITGRIWLESLTAPNRIRVEVPAIAKQSGPALRAFLSMFVEKARGQRRVKTERDELLAVYSVATRFAEMTGRRTITHSDRDQLALRRAKRDLKLH